RLPAELQFLAYEARDTVASLSSGIFIEGAAGGNPRTDAAVIIRLSADAEALFLALRKHRHGRKFSVDDLVTISEAVDAHQDAVTNWLKESVPRERVIEAVELLY